MNNEEKILEILALMQGDIANVKKAMDTMEAKMATKEEVNGLKAYIENTVAKDIRTVAEGHGILNDKLDALHEVVLDIKAKQDNMAVTVSLHDRQLSIAK